MSALLDTQALTWALAGDERSSGTARLSMNDSDNPLVVSLASGWEMIIKAGLAKIISPIPIQQMLSGELERSGFELLPIEASHLHRLPGLPLHHGTHSTTCRSHRR